MSRTGHVHDFIPEFSMSDRFCYFLDLFTSSAYQYGSLRQAKRTLFREAGHKILAPIQKQLFINKDNSDKVISTAIEFLKKAAESERNKEISLIDQYIKELKNNKMLKNILQSHSKYRDDLTDLIEELKNFSANPNSVDVKNFYQKLILLINTIKSTLNDYQKRLEQLASSNRKTSTDIRRDFYATRLPADIDILFKTMMGTISKQTENSMTVKIAQRVIRFATEKLANNEAFLNHPFEVLAGIMTDFEKYLQTEYYKEGDLTKALDQLPIDEYFDKYELMQTHFITVLLNQSQELDRILETIRMQTGLKKITSKDDQYKKNKNLLDTNRRSKVGQERLELHQELKAILGKQYSKNISIGFAWDLRSKTGKHGSVYELILPVLKERALKVRGSAATDIIEVDIGQLELSTQYNPQLTTVAQEVTEAIEKRVKHIRNNRTEDLTTVINEMNETIRLATERIDDFLKQEGIKDDVFVYHESLKLYTEIEQHKGNGFHGRELQILNALDQIYSADGVEGLNLISKDVFYNIALNLSSLAIGGGVVEEIENYLSIFAGLLMFDDVQNIALDIANNTIQQVQQHGRTKHIHLYLLNDVYVPGSLLLTTISLALQNGYTNWKSSLAARFEINTSEADKEISTYLQHKNGTYDKDEDWKNEAEKIRQGTKARIIFLTSFISFIKDLQQYMH